MISVVPIPPGKGKVCGQCPEQATLGLVFVVSGRPVFKGQPDDGCTFACPAHRDALVDEVVRLAGQAIREESAAVGG